MTTSPNPYRGFRFPAEIIEHTVWHRHGNQAWQQLWGRVRLTA
jgi:hypothetical protein